MMMTPNYWYHSFDFIFLLILLLLSSIASIAPIGCYFLQFLNRFLGMWKLIKPRSDSMDEVSKAMGVSWAVRRVRNDYYNIYNLVGTAGNRTVHANLPILSRGSGGDNFTITSDE